MCTFARRQGSSIAVTVVPRLLAGLIAKPGMLPTGRKIWGDTRIVFPLAEPGDTYENVITGETVSVELHKGSAVMYLSKLCEHFPAALLKNI